MLKQVELQDFFFQKRFFPIFSHNFKEHKNGMAHSKLTAMLMTAFLQAYFSEHLISPIFKDLTSNQLIQKWKK